MFFGFAMVAQFMDTIRLYCKCIQREENRHSLRIYEFLPINVKYPVRSQFNRSVSVKNGCKSARSH